MLYSLLLSGLLSLCLAELNYILLSDLHYDFKYGTQDAYHVERGCGVGAPVYGGHGCDSPWLLIEATLTKAQELNPNPDGIIILGDFSRHEESTTPREVQKEAVLVAWNRTTNRIKELWPGTNVLHNLQTVDFNVNAPIVGNNDFQTDYEVNVVTDLPPGPGVPTNPWFTRLAEQYALNLSSSEMGTWLHGGFMVREQPAGSNIYFVNINSVLYADKTEVPAEFAADPSGQFAWLRGVLQDLESRDGFVYITGHNPPSLDDYANAPQWKEEYIVQFFDLIEPFLASNLIKGLFFSHTHRDDIRVLPGAGEAVFLLAQAISPLYQNDPGFKTIKLDRNSGRLLDFTAYAPDVPLPTTLLPWELTWEVLYTAPTLYPAAYQGSSEGAGLTNSDFRAALEAMYNNPKSWNDYHDATYANAAGHPSTPAIAKAYFCGMQTFSKADWTTCNAAEPFGCVDAGACTCDHCGESTVCGPGGVCTSQCGASPCCVGDGVCADSAIRQCVGAFDPFCLIGTNWDAQCAQEARGSCGLIC